MIDPSTIPTAAKDPNSYQNKRINLLAAAAFLIVLACLAAVIFTSNLDDYVKGIITVILGKFLGYVDNIYTFEFNTTRGSKTKDDVIATLAAGTPPPTDAKEIVKADLGAQPKAPGAPVAVQK